jgi:hypothetical protein
VRQLQALRRAVGVALALSGSVSLPLVAQAITTAALHGVVSGRHSAGLEEAVVSVTNAAKGECCQTTTRAGGTNNAWEDLPRPGHGPVMPRS